MIPRFITLSEKERLLLKIYSTVIAKRAERFSSTFCEWIQKDERLSKIVKGYPVERMREGIVKGYKGIVCLDDKWDNSLGKLSEMHAMLGISQEDLLYVYDMYYSDMEAGVDDLEISNEDKLILKSAIQKRIGAEMFVHVEGFERVQREMIHEREKFYKALSDVSRIFVEGSHNSLEELLNIVAEVLVKDIELKLVHIGYIEGGESYLKIIASAGEAVNYAKELKISLDQSTPYGRGPAGITLRSGKPFVLNDFDDPIFEPWNREAKKYGLGSSANVSFTTSDNKIWNISLYNKIGDKFSQRMEDLLNALSSTMKVFIEKRLKDLELERIRQLEKGLTEVQKVLIGNHSIEEIYTLVAEIMSANTPCAHTIHISVPNGRWMKTVASSGKGENLFLKTEFIPTDPSDEMGFLATTQAYSKRKIVSIDVQNDKNYQKLWTIYPELNVKYVGSWPIFEEGKEAPIAVLTIGSYDKACLGSDMQVVVDQLVSSIQIAINQSRARQKIEWMSLHDALTELPNRTYFEQSAKDAIKLAKREHKKIAIGFMDIDNFKEWNDTFGHTAGDELLKEIGKTLQSVIRGGDQVARMGGDEFLFHVKIDKLSDLVTFEKRVRKVISEIRNGKMKIICSIGWAIYPDDGEDLKMLISLADKNMYTQKKGKVRKWEI